MNSLDEPWYRPEPPDQDSITRLWVDMFSLAADHVEDALGEGEHPTKNFLGGCSCGDLHVCMETLEAVKSNAKWNVEARTEIPTFDALEEESDAQVEWEPDVAEGGLALEDDAEMGFEETSTLVLSMQIRRMRRFMRTRGIIDHKYHAVIVPPQMAFEVVKGLTDDNRKLLADVLLYQEVQNIRNQRNSNDDGWMDPHTIIDLFLDKPNVRAFYRQIAGTS